ncbi:MAG: YbgC/FadM family acyl-CoA thioesterase [Endomicrobia bacterium]|nr:YbgC/FadM family acyl-CoA thioesterase [Endomicrobiia bacterium]
MEHSIKIKIYYEDTDAGGVVYYANYLKYFERARTEFLESRGIRIADLAKSGIKFVVVTVEISYLSPAKLGEIIEVVTKLSDISKASLTFEYDIFSFENKRKLVRGKTKIVCVNSLLKVQKLPVEILQRLKLNYFL